MRELGGIRHRTERNGWQVAVDLLVRLCCHRLLPSASVRVDRSTRSAEASIAFSARALARCQRRNS
ncbi:hypothetical protein [Goodfellowiella coeruleoviolacea]|uniref:Uncharacterized protein n=1 Tax=Goodfellowiella coeruleoviolacea TaxID=334858 RepID=A0AAE3KHH1_9PSEU|nr:hypothetical protein [Goodfellowiella coeruleoviolacea]MCP2167315.1 hypothetical protein [Goodfellowiella coeruleoviolacea]